MALIPCSLDVWQANMQKEGINSQSGRWTQTDFVEVEGGTDTAPEADTKGF